MDAIKVEGLTKRYGKIDALRGVDLTVSEGTVFGLVGPNGAGKTTLIKALVRALRPSEGEVRVSGLDPLGDRAKLRQQIGYMPKSPALYEDLSTRINGLYLRPPRKAGLPVHTPDHTPLRLPLGTPHRGGGSAGVGRVARPTPSPFSMPTR